MKDDLLALVIGVVVAGILVIIVMMNGGPGAFLGAAGGSLGGFAPGAEEPLTDLSDNDEPETAPADDEKDVLTDEEISTETTKAVTPAPASKPVPKPQQKTSKKASKKK